jgi:peptide-methionine (S)-S-oxide reductase
MDGVVTTLVGYAGGTKRNPTYHSLSDHTETIQIYYDPQKVSYEQLLEVFWANHDPTALPWSTQYKSIILYHGDEQKRLATASKARLEERLKRTIRTEISLAREFYPAEDYHQKYSLRGSRELMAILKEAYPSDADLVASTAAARLNGYLGILEKPKDFGKQLETAGLKRETVVKLLNALKIEALGGPQCRTGG